MKEFGKGGAGILGSRPRHSAASGQILFAERPLLSARSRLCASPPPPPSAAAQWGWASSPAQSSSPSPTELGRGVSALGPDSALRAPSPAHRPPRGRWDGKTQGGPDMRIRRPVHKPEAGGLLCGRTFHAAPCAGVLAQLENFWEGGREERPHVRWLLCRRQSRALLLRPLVRPLLFLLPPVRGPGRLRPRASQPHV